MRTTHKAELRLCFFIFPDDGIAVINPLQFRIVDGINLCIFLYQALALLNSLGCYPRDMVETYGAV